MAAELVGLWSFRLLALDPPTGELHDNDGDLIGKAAPPQENTTQYMHER